jgi:multisubunit Na+/H+ antiporter MnhC subunit
MTFVLTRWLYLLLSLFFISFLNYSAFAQEEFLTYIAIIDVNSYITPTGMYPPRRLAELAREKEIKILVFSDSFLRRWEYALPILPRIFKVALEQGSVVRYGIKRYLQDIRDAQDRFPDMLILEGVEVAPFYWWSGNFFRKNLTLNDYNRHLLVVGLQSSSDYVHLPVVGNRYLLPQLKDIPIVLIAALLLLSGIFFYRRGKKRRKTLALTLIGAGIVFVLNNFPFSASRHHSYQGQKQFLPYQDLIDYVTKKGALVFWAHPVITRLASWGRFAGVSFYTPSYPEALVLTSGYTGFGINMLPGTDHSLILPGQQWDSVLMSYCHDQRPRPVWAFAEADYHSGSKIDALRNVFFLPAFNRQALYQAFYQGRFYACYHSDNTDISLSDFHITDSQREDRSAFIGEELEVRGKPRLYIRGNCLIRPQRELRIEIIRNGVVIKKISISGEGSFDLRFQDEAWQESTGKSYYRLNFFAGSQIILVTNPIFIISQITTDKNHR